MSKEDERTGLGPETQRDGIKTWLKFQNEQEIEPTYTLINVTGTDRLDWDKGYFFENASGGSVINRPLFFKILQNICKKLNKSNWGAVKQCDGNCVFAILRQSGLEHIIVYAMDRLSRDTSDTLAISRFLDSHKIELHTVTGTAFGKKDPKIGQVRAEEKGMATMMSATRQMYKDFVSDKTKDAAVRRMKEHNRWWGKLPHGFAKVNPECKCKVLPCSHGPDAGKITPVYPTIVTVIKYLLMGYNPYEIADLNLIDEGGNRWNYSQKIWKLKRTLTDIDRSKRIVLPDALYLIKPVNTNRGRLVTQGLSQIHHLASSSDPVDSVLPQAQWGQKAILEREKKFQEKLQDSLRHRSLVEQNAPQQEDYTSDQNPKVEKNLEENLEENQASKVQQNHQVPSEFEPLVVNKPQEEKKKEKAVHQDFEPLFSD
jgi:hypothetical protein